jgi:hypothetical protein
VLLGAVPASAQGPASAPRGVPGPLFTADDVLDLTIEGPLSHVIKERGDDKESFPGTVRYRAASGNEIVIPVVLRTRGNFRLRAKTCGFPPLRLEFEPSATLGTVFEGQGRLKLVTHCQDGRAEYEQFVLQEYLIYRIYELLTPRSFRARLAHITYLDDDGKREPVTRYGFFLEPEEVMAERNGMEGLHVPVVAPEQMEQADLVRLEVFQFLIGNTDWEPFQPEKGEKYCCHNAVLIGSMWDQVVIPVPYDFDWSGVISAPYARPAPTLGIRSVRERRYWGVCRPRAQLDAALPEFRAQRDAIHRLVRAQPGLEPKRAERMIEYLDEFYGIIGDPHRVSREMEAKCRGG